MTPDAHDLWKSVIVIGLPPTIASLAAFLSSLRNGRKADAASTKADVALGKADLLAGKADEIHRNTNGAMADVQSELLAARRETVALHDETEALKLEIIGLKALIDKLTHNGPNFCALKEKDQSCN